MYYAQKDYHQALGYGDQPMSAVGCLLFSICNRLKKRNLPSDPLVLNEWFKAHGVFQRGADGQANELSWSAITKYMPQIAVSGPGYSQVPSSGNAIVKFHYTSVHTGHPIDHYCAVDRVVDGQVFIIDSYDGLIKSPSSYQGVYGHVQAWVTDTVRIPAKPPEPPIVHKPAPAPLGARLPIGGESYTVVKELPGYMSSGQAAIRTNSNSRIPPGTYNVFNKFNGQINVTTQPGHPGWWINPADNVQPPPPSEKEPDKFTILFPVPGYQTSNEAANHVKGTDVVTVAADIYYVFNTANGMYNLTKNKAVPGAWINPADNHAAPAPDSAATPKPPNWRSTYQSHQETYIALNSMIVHDLGTSQPDVPLYQYDSVPLAGTFTGPDGILYGRTMNSTFPEMRKDPAKQALGPLWYGIPMADLVRETEVFSSTTDTADHQAIGAITPRDRLVLTAASVSGFLDRLSNLFTKQHTNYKIRSK